MRNKILGLLGGISALTLACAGIAYAAEEHMNGPGKTVTRAEAQAHAEKLFARLDLNHDGKLDGADRAAQLGKAFDRLDANHDGTISRDEFVAGHEKGMMDHGMMGQGPGDGDRAADHDGDHGGDHQPGWGMHRPHGAEMREHMGMMMAIMALADPAHTHVVSHDAFISAALKLFDQADTDHDGKLTPDERKAAMQAMRQHMRMDRPMGGPDMPPPGN